MYRLPLNSSLVLLSGFLLTFAGCSKDSHEQVARDYLQVMEKIVSTCSEISDPQAAENCKEKIGGLLDQLKQLKTRSEDLGDADQATQKTIEKKYETELKSLTTRFSETFEKMEKEQEIAQVLESEFKTLAILLNSKPIKIN
ncbi:MAG: hypothetical protein VX768_11005 [Planctomycetota bacterium]|nr:hypothetical protein [Planctomycetota bacterium]